MRHLISIGLLFIVISASGQTLSLSDKVQVFKTSDGRLHSRRFYDSVKFEANQFVTLANFKDSKDSTYYLISYFPKSELVDRYQREGNFCWNSERKKLEEIKKLTLYRETALIKIVSFKSSVVGDRIIREIPKTNGAIDFKKMYEVKTLDQGMTDKLLDILVNYDNGHNGMEIAMCYDPRNGILFLNKSDKVLGYIEICFDCQQFKMEPKTLPVASFCNEKLDVIQGIFMKAGITYGMIEGMD